MLHFADSTALFEVNGCGGSIRILGVGRTFLRVLRVCNAESYWLCNWCHCYCAGRCCCAGRWLKSVKSAPRKFNARPNLISFSRFMALVMRSAGMSWVDTLQTQSRPVFSHSCTVSIFSLACFILSGPLRLNTASALCESVQSSGIVWYRSLVPSKWRISFLILRIAVILGFLSDRESVFTLCWMSGRWWLRCIALPTHVLQIVGHRRRTAVSRWWILVWDIFHSECCCNSVKRKGLFCHAYPFSNFRRFIAKGLTSSSVLCKRTASCMFSFSLACARKRSTFG